MSINTEGSCMYAIYRPPPDTAIDSWVADIMGGDGHDTQPQHPDAVWLRHSIEQGVIKVLAEPTMVTVRKFDLNWGRGLGTFCVAFNGVELQDRFYCAVEGDGWLHYAMPTTQCPNGLHADYPLYVFTQATHNAIADAVRAVVPRLKPWGLNKESGEMCTQLTSLKARGAETSSFLGVRAQISSPGFSKSVSLCTDSAVGRGKDSCKNNARQ